MTMKRTKFNIRTIAVTGMLGALATVLMFLDRYLELQYVLSRMRSTFFIHRQVESENYLTLS